VQQQQFRQFALQLLKLSTGNMPSSFVISGLFSFYQIKKKKRMCEFILITNLMTEVVKTELNVKSERVNFHFITIKHFISLTKIYGIMSLYGMVLHRILE
jgi:hypothetical protein